MASEMMAIGDSLYNGVRSLGIDAARAAHSTPAMVARALGVPFTVPDYISDKPAGGRFLFNLEEALHPIDPGLVARLGRDAVEDGKWWLDPANRKKWSARPFFDNLSFAGATISDLHQRTARPALELARAAHGRLSQNPSDATALGELWFYLNLAFILNPSGDPALDDASAVAQVGMRRPKRLLVNIGSNEGLFRIGVMGNVTEPFLNALKAIPSLAFLLADAIARACPELPTVYYNLLPRPRILANLAPRSDSVMNTPVGDGYYPQYVSRLGLEPFKDIKAGELRDFDVEVRRINALTAQRLRDRLGDKVVPVDLFGVFDEFDGKHNGTARYRTVPLPGGGLPIKISNRPFATTPGGRVTGGCGLFGIDNMHPTFAGYAALANPVLAAIAKHEGMAETPTVDIVAAAQADSLLMSPPPALRLASLVLSVALLFVGPKL
jgi:lysophospholipase L1-like esterase